MPQCTCGAAAVVLALRSKPACRRGIILTIRLSVIIAANILSVAVFQYFICVVGVLHTCHWTLRLDAHLSRTIHCRFYLHTSPFTEKLAGGEFVPL